jgi:UDP-N-acetylglucosamine--dolichyl-phosphate N-acetylglucosaminephosphotransferase
VKAVLPLFAALPLVAVRAGETMMNIPLVGEVNFGILYPLLLVPIGIAGASNVTNVFAGFNGMEAGMGAIAMLSLSVIAWHFGGVESLILLLAMAGALVAFLRYNWHPAKVFIGDVGTLSIGAVIAAAVIIGNFEMAGVIVLIPHMLDFFIKLANGLPNKNWWGTPRGGRLYCDGRPIHLAQVVMKLFGGISESNLTLSLMAVESLFGFFTVMLFLRYVPLL